MIKAFVPALVIASALAAPTFAFAQAQDNNGPVTRAEVRADLVRLENAGYNPSTDRVDYPQNIQAAEARVHAQQGDSGYGASTAGSSASGSARSTVSMSDRNSVYFGH